MSGMRQLEWLIRAHLQAGLKAVRETPGLLDTMFPDLSENSRSQLAEWLAVTDIGCHLAFPLDLEGVPCWTVHMTGEAPVYEPIGEAIQYTEVDGELAGEYGEFLRKAYQITTLTQHPDQTIVLAAILQHILKSLKKDLAAAGFYELKTGQQDALNFKIDHLPVRLYARITYLTVLVEDTYVRVETTASGVDIGTPGVLGADGAIEVVFPTP